MTKTITKTKTQEVKKKRGYVYILTESVDYEGTTILGVFSSSEKAFIQQAIIVAERRNESYTKDEIVEEFDGESEGRRYWTKKIVDMAYCITEWKVAK